MILVELIDNIENLTDDSTIYAETNPSWNENSNAIACLETDDNILPKEAAGMIYFLEVSIAKKVIQTWQKWRNGAIPNRQEKFEAIVYYAKNDAYLPVK